MALRYLSLRCFALSRSILPHLQRLQVRPTVGDLGESGFFANILSLVNHLASEPLIECPRHRIFPQNPQACGTGKIEINEQQAAIVRQIFERPRRVAMLR
jgi:hypothetical protein